MFYGEATHDARDSAASCFGFIAVTALRDHEDKWPAAPCNPNPDVPLRLPLFADYNRRRQPL